MRKAASNVLKYTMHFLVYRASISAVKKALWKLHLRNAPLHQDSHVNAV